MRKVVILSLLMLLMIAQVFGQLKSFNISGRISKAEGKIIYLNLRMQELNDSATVTNGRFSFKGMVSDFEFIALSIGDDRLLSAVEPGKLNIDATNGKLVKATTSGQASAKDFASYVELSKHYHNKLLEIRRQHQIATEKKDTAQMAALGRQNDLLIKVGQPKAVQGWISQNSTALIGPDIARTELQNLPIAELEKLLTRMAPRVKSSRSGVAFANFINAKKASKLGQPAPVFTQNDVNGKAVSLANYLGKYVLIDFWASWCAPCRADNPSLVATYQQFKAKNFTILGVSLDAYKNPWLKAINDDGLTRDHVSDLKGWENSVAKMYAVGSVPQSFLIDPQGKIIAQNLRGEELKAKLSELIK